MRLFPWPLSPTLSLEHPRRTRGRVAVMLLLIVSKLIASCPQLHAATTAPATRPATHPAEDVLLDDLERRSFRYFWDEASPTNGLIADRALADGGGARIASIAATGFGLTALCIADSRGWITHEQAYARALLTLRFLRDDAENVHGYFYHFLNLNTGKRAGHAELSSIDTALLVAGILTCREHFAGTEAADCAGQICDRVDWPWMLDGEKTLRMAWTPESGFLAARWSRFNEGMLLYLLGMGSGTHALPPECWDAWEHGPVITYAGMTFIQCPPLFTHQYPQAWFDLRGRRDDYADYFRNARLATLANRQFCVDLRARFPTYSEKLWGLTASDSATGYRAWGGPPARGAIDGTVVPCASAGSLPFAAPECLETLAFLRETFGDRIYRKYGFVDAFNPQTGWVDPDALGIDVGITLMMAENYRTGFVWRTFMRTPEAARALKAARFRSADPANAPPGESSVYPDAQSSRGRNAKR